MREIHLTLTVLCISVATSSTLDFCKTNLSNLATANNIFSVNLYRRMAKEMGNILVSPAGLSTSLAMLYLGARGQTAKEMENVLGYKRAGVNLQHFHSSFKQLILNLQATAERKYVFRMANELMVQSGFHISQQYNDDLEFYYETSLKKVNFSRNPDEILREINSWVARNTNNKISTFLTTRPSPFTKLLMLNAIYFKGSWQNPFAQNLILSVPFYNNGNEASDKNVKMMILHHNVPYVKYAKMEAVKLSYYGGDISMLILLPNELDGLGDLEQQLSLADITKILKNMKETMIKISLPSFKLEYSTEMKEFLNGLGMNSVFGEDSSNLSGICGESSKLFVSKIYQKVVVNVNQNGTEAAFVTDLEYEPRSAATVRNFRVDHPFLFFIINEKNRMILFVGRVNEL
ncbi:intracellular coagulation inhibitor 1-like [Centruroides vittatus]|uniref:intracellular coagulation inhibitor 1-like n=1 Tax=Centruroides vittatus TaxID=120091 RepID=UPI0035108DD5